MKNKITLLASFLPVILSVTPVFAQHDLGLDLKSSLQRSFLNSNKLSFGFAGGITVMNSDNRSRNYKSSIGLMKANGYGPNLSVGVLAQLSPKFGLLGNADYTSIKAYQDEGENRVKDSFSFKSKILTVSGSIVFNLANRVALLDYYGGLPDGRRVVIIPFLRAGIGLKRYNATSYIDGKEDMTKRMDPSIAAVIPVGGGLKLKWSDKVSIAPEFTYNFSTTDRIDTRSIGGGYTGKNDNYVSAIVRLLYTPSKKQGPVQL